MREAVFFVIFYVFVNTAKAVKPKSVNLALETVLQFDKKDHSADVEVLDRVQGFLDNIKNVMKNSKNIKRRSNENSLKFTDFLLEATEILKKYDDNDLEDFFAVLDNQSRKYNYKGCKFYELVDNNDVRRFMSNKLEQAKDTSAKRMRRYLSDVSEFIANDNFEGRHRELVNLVNSLYDGATNKFEKVLKNLRGYQARAKDSVLNLDDIVSNALRTLFFDHYSNLNENARQQLKTEVGHYWLSSQYNGGNNKKGHYSHDNNDMEEIQDYKSKLKVIDVPNQFSKKNHHRLRIKNLKHSYKKDKRHKTKRMTSKTDIDFINFKKTTREQPVTISDEDSTKRNKKPYGVTQGLIDEDLSNSYELKKPINIDKSYKAIKPPKVSSNDDSDKGLDTEKTSSGVSKDKKGISIEFANKKYMFKQKKHKKQNIGHITYDVERRHKFKAHDYTDEEGSDKDSTENADSSEEVTKPKGSEEEYLYGEGVLIGGQNIHNMQYRAGKHRDKSSERKEKEIVEEVSVDTELPLTTEKIKDRQKSHHKSSKKAKEKKTTTVPSEVEKESTTKAIDTKDSKDSAFASSDEGITIETFENDNEKKHSNLRKALKHTTHSNVRKQIQNLEKQLQDVKHRIELVTADKGNKTEGDAKIESKDKGSDDKNNNTEEKAESDAKVKASDRNKTYENGVFSEANNTQTAETEKTITTYLDTTYTTTIAEYETDIEGKPNRTTIQERKENTKHPIFRSEVIDIESGKSRESNENYNDISTLKDNDLNKSKAAVLNETTSMNTNIDSIFKTDDDKSATSLIDVVSVRENMTSPKPEKSKIMKTSGKKEEKGTIEMITTVIDLTKHLQNSDTVVVNMKKKSETLKENQESTRNLSDELGLPKSPNFKDGKLDDPFNDLDVNLDFI